MKHVCHIVFIIHIQINKNHHKRVCYELFEKTQNLSNENFLPIIINYAANIQISKLLPQKKKITNKIHDTLDTHLFALQLG